MKHPILFILALIISISSYSQKSNYHLLIGTYNSSENIKGIYSYELDLAKSILAQKSATKGISNPSYLTVTPNKKFVYSINESPTNSTANAFNLDEKSGKLTFINSSETKGKGACFISATKEHVITANYGAGSTSIFGRKKDGSLTETLQVIQHYGSSIHPTRQTTPHVHQTIFSPDGKFLLANDLGKDKVIVYKYNPKAKVKILSPYDSISSKPGSGPRHLVFSRDGKIVYLLQELDGTISVMRMKKGFLSLIQETTVVKDTNTNNSAADIHISPDGKFLYATNRGTANNISCFLIKKDGTLNFIYQIPTNGKGPRNFSFTPDGNYLFVANQLSNNIVIFKRNKTTGILTDTDHCIKVESPVCLVFY